MASLLYPATFWLPLLVAREILMPLEKLAEHFPAETRLIEIDVRSGMLAAQLAEAGCTKYLGVARDEKSADRLARLWPTLRERITTTSDRRVVRHNNAEVLLLSGRSPLYLWRYREVRHATRVAWVWSIRPLVLLGMLGWLARYLAGQYRWPTCVTYTAKGGRRRRLLVTEVTRVRRKHHSALHFIPHVLGLRGFFDRLEHCRAQYAVLRWFEELPTLVPGEDVDLLIADESYDDVMALLESEPGIQPCDVYTPSGLPRTDYLEASYYPPTLARQILDRAETYRSLCRAPNELDYFRSLAYHAVYHKGAKSGLPGSELYSRKTPAPKHNFTAILTQMAEQFCVDATISLEGLHAYLQSEGWSPPADLFARMAARDPHNRWLAELSARSSSDSLPPGVSVFLLREKAVEYGRVEQIVEMIAEAGFEILEERKLTDDEVAYGAPRTRGGNWGPGPGDHQGGDPAILVLAFDPAPLPPTRKQRRRHPLLVNGRVQVKDQVREAVNAALPAGVNINALHSSDYPAEAQHLLEVFAPDLLERVALRCHEEGPNAQPRKAA